MNFNFGLDERLTDLRYVVQISENGNVWVDAATYVPLGPGQGFRRDAGAGNPTSQGFSNASAPGFFTASENLSTQNGVHRFLRLKAVGTGM